MFSHPCLSLARKENTGLLMGLDPHPGVLGRMSTSRKRNEDFNVFSLSAEIGFIVANVCAEGKVWNWGPLSNDRLIPRGDLN